MFCLRDIPLQATGKFEEALKLARFSEVALDPLAPERAVWLAPNDARRSRSNINFSQVLGARSCLRTLANRN